MGQEPIKLHSLKPIWENIFTWNRQVSTLHHLPDIEKDFFYYYSPKHYIAQHVRKGQWDIFITNSKEHYGFTCLYRRSKTKVGLSCSFGNKLLHFNFLEIHDFLDLNFLKKLHRCLDFQPPKCLTMRVHNWVYHIILHDLYKAASAEIMWLVVQAFEINLVERTTDKEDLWLFELIQQLIPRLQYCKTLFPESCVKDFEGYVTCMEPEDVIMQRLSPEIKELADLLAEPAIFGQLPTLGLTYSWKKFFVVEKRNRQILPIYLSNIRYLIYLLYFLKEWDALEHLCQYALKRNNFFTKKINKNK